MDKIFESDTQVLFFRPEINAIEEVIKFRDTALFSNKAFYQAEMDALLEHCQKLKPTQLIINSKAASHRATPEFKEWLHTTIYPKLATLGIIRKAYIMSDDILNQLSIEQSATDDPNPLFEFNFFNQLDDGIAWLAKRLEEDRL